MRTSRLFLVMLCGVVAACTSVAPRDLKSVVEAYRRFLLDTETPFPRRAQKHLGLRVEVDPGTLEEGRCTRLGPAPESAFPYATVTLSKADPRLNIGTMTTRFDSSVACVTYGDLAVLGQAFPGVPIVDHAMRNGELLVARLIPTPE